MSWNNAFVSDSRSVNWRQNKSRQSRRKGKAVSQSLFESLEARELFSVLTVTSAADNGDGSLRQMLASANSGDVIQFAANLSGKTINLTSGTLIVGAEGASTNVSILGPGAGKLTINGGNIDSIFSVNSGSTATISGLTLTEGQGVDGFGGAIENLGTLVVSNCVLSNNSDDSYGGAIFNGGQITVTGSTISNNQGAIGGAVFNCGTAAINDSVFSDNEGFGGAINNTGELTTDNVIFTGDFSSAAGGGGAVWNDGTYTASESTFSDNQAGFPLDAGGAIDNEGNLLATGDTFNDNSATTGGGAIFTDSQATVVNSTFVGNDAGLTPLLGGGAVQALNGPLDVVNCTIEQNSAFLASGGGIDVVAPATLNLDNSIVTGNSGGNIVGTKDAGSADNLIGGSADLGPLTNNGGPTETMAPLPGSPAIGAGSAALATLPDGQPLVTDGRGDFRVNGNGSVDIGAVQTGTAAEPASLVVNSTSESVDYVAGQLTLRQAIGFAEFNGTPSTITFATGVFNDASATTINLTEPLEVTAAAQDLTIQGPDAAAVTVNGGGTTTPWLIDYGANVTLSDLTVTGGNANGGFGGGVENDGNLTVNNAVFTSNTAFFGGAMDNEGILNVNDSTFSDNAAPGGYGGAISNEGILTVTGSTFTGNAAAGGEGGGIYSSYLAEVEDSTFNDNAAFDGGAAYNDGSMYLGMSTLCYNDATDEGGAIFNDGDDMGAVVTVTNCTIVDNDATNAGGGIECFDDAGGDVYLFNSIVSMNTVDDGSISDIDGTLDPSSADNLIDATAQELLLAQLGNYGGPTQTMPPQAGSIALDMGNAGQAVDANGLPLTTNQQGRRISQEFVDIGSV